MKISPILRAAIVASTVACAAAFAQAPPGDALYRQLGGQSGLVSLVDDFIARLLADPRMEPFFRDADQPQLKAQIVAQFCELSGGPCKREGKDMKTVHSAQDVTRTDFNALVEVLQQSMDARGIPFAVQRRLLAKLAPMHREIVNAP